MSSHFLKHELCWSQKCCLLITKWLQYRYRYGSHFEKVWRHTGFWVWVLGKTMARHCITAFSQDICSVAKYWTIFKLFLLFQRKGQCNKMNYFGRPVVLYFCRILRKLFNSWSISDLMTKKLYQKWRQLCLGARSIQHCNVLSEKLISQPTVPAEPPFFEQIIFTH